MVAMVDLVNLGLLSADHLCICGTGLSLGDKGHFVPVVPVCSHVGGCWLPKFSPANVT